MKNTAEFTLWGLPAGQTDRLYEKVLTSTTDAARIELVKGLATRDGFHSFRVTRLTLPNFADRNLVNI